MQKGAVTVWLLRRYTIKQLEHLASRCNGWKSMLMNVFVVAASTEGTTYSKVLLARGVRGRYGYGQLPLVHHHPKVFEIR